MKLAVYILAAGLLAALCLAAGAASAHSLKLFALAKDGKLQGEAYVPGRGKIKQGTVEVYGAGGTLLAKTQVNEKGAFSIPLPSGKPPFKLVLKARAGHRAEYVMSAADLAGGGPPAPKDEGLSVRSVVESLGIFVALIGLAFYLRNLWEKRKKKRE